MGHTKQVQSVCWNSDDVFTVCYSPDGKMVATGMMGLKIWDATTGELLKTNIRGRNCVPGILDPIGPRMGIDTAT
ncbi:hypothetical protein BDR05DRAFT_279675 [Suillus weaverae]|nr:hypothetical protein BDR05DRAFT_279675 [Suillus weaverae]